MNTDRHGAASTAIAMALALLPLAYLIWLCVTSHVDIPFGDQWELVPRLSHLDAGTFTFRQDLWQQHNEHRPLIPILLMLGLAWMTDWNISVEIAVNVVAGLAIFAVYVAALRSAFRDLPPWRWWALPLVSLIVFSPAQWENWLWGWQMQIFMCVLGSLLGFWLLAAPGRSLGRIAAAIVAGIFSTYSVGAGLSFWPIGLIAFALNPDRRTLRDVAVWLIASAVVIGTYFIDYHQVPGHRPVLSNFESLDAIRTLVVYVCKYLGAPVAGYSGRAAGMAGALGLMVFAGLLAVGWRGRRTAAFMFPCLAGVNVVADAGMTALSRAAYGTDQALSSRYQTIGAPFWIAIILLAILAIHQWRTRPRWQSAWTVASACAAVALCVSMIQNGQSGLIGANQRMDFLRAARPSLRAGLNWRILARLYLDDIPSIRERAGTLRMLEMSVYRDEPQ